MYQRLSFLTDDLLIAYAVDGIEEEAILTAAASNELSVRSKLRPHNDTACQWSLGIDAGLASRHEVLTSNAVTSTAGIPRGQQELLI